MTPLELLFEVDGLPVADVPEELERLYGGPVGLAEPCLYANFVSTVDGVVAIPAIPRSNALVADGSEGDRFVMGLLRAFADVVLIGAGTLASSPKGTWLPEKVYPPAAEQFAELRRRLGRSERPEIAILTGHGSIDPAHPLLASGALVLTSDAGAVRLDGAVPDAVDRRVPGGRDRHRPARRGRGASRARAPGDPLRSRPAHARRPARARARRRALPHHLAAPRGRPWAHEPVRARRGGRPHAARACARAFAPCAATSSTSSFATG